MVSLMVVHNQMVLLGFLMGIHLAPFIHDESPLPLIFDTKYQQQITDCLHKLGYLHPSHIYRTPMSNGGHMSVALAGEWSDELGYVRPTMPERGQRSVALAGSFSAKLGRDRMTMEEICRLGGSANAALNTELFVMYSLRPSAEHNWGPWEGGRSLHPLDLLEGISRTKLASGAC